MDDMPLNWLVTEFLSCSLLKRKLNLHLNEKKKRKSDGLLQIYFEKKKTHRKNLLKKLCHDKNLAIITSFHLFQICQKNFSMLVTIVRSTFRSGWFLHFSFSSSLECQITTRDKSRTRFFCLFFPFILRASSE